MVNSDAPKKWSSASPSRPPNLRASDRRHKSFAAADVGAPGLVGVLGDRTVEARGVAGVKVGAGVVAAGRASGARAGRVAREREELARGTAAVGVGGGGTELVQQVDSDPFVDARHSPVCCARAAAALVSPRR